MRACARVPSCVRACTNGYARCCSARACVLARTGTRDAVPRVCADRTVCSAYALRVSARMFLPLHVHVWVHVRVHVVHARVWYVQACVCYASVHAVQVAYARQSVCVHVNNVYAHTCSCYACVWFWRVRVPCVSSVLCAHEIVSRRACVCTYVHTCFFVRYYALECSDCLHACTGAVRVLCAYVLACRERPKTCTRARACARVLRFVLRVRLCT